MAETAGVLSFGFEADFSGFTRAADSAGQTLDRLAGRAGAWAEATAGGLARTFDTAAGQQAKAAAGMMASANASKAPVGLSTSQVAGRPNDPGYVRRPRRQFGQGDDPPLRAIGAAEDHGCGP